jgi:putative sterol carrier protein
VADFLSAEWFEHINAQLSRQAASDHSTWRVVLSWSDGPSSQPHAVTLTCTNGVASIDRGDHLAADAVVVLSYRDAESLAAGTLDAANALRDGRFKLRGDASALVAMVNALRN